jgi:hypothetical protein
VEQGYLKSSAIATFSTTTGKSDLFLAHKSISNYSLYTMRFISSTSIVFTVALLSLIAPGVNADVAAVITTPSSGQKINAFDSINVIWYAVTRENPSAVCHHRSLTAGITAGP